IEPRVSKQWFVKMEELAKPAIDAVKQGQTKFVPERFDKIYFNWMENIRDWCISRQLWWGHRIPAYYCADCGEIIVSKDKATKCTKCGSTNIAQDPDTLDTWFSSALWPFSTLGWPNNTEDLKYFYPTNTLVTGYDIIFFWVARMIFSALEHTGEVPFDTVLIHGLVRDAQGRKMSKSLGNGIDPLEVIDQYGADALRLTLITGNSPGNDMRFSDEKIKASRNFANKLWNAARFINMNLTIDKITLPTALCAEDKWILSKYNTLVKEVTDNIDKYELGVAVSKLYDFIWDILCDWYIEIVKTRLQSENSGDAQKILLYVMTNTLKLLHPFMPFITEEIWQSLPNDCESIMIAEYPTYREELDFTEEEEEFSMIMEAIKGIRNQRSEMNVPPSRKAALFIKTKYTNTFNSAVPFFKSLASASNVEVSSEDISADKLKGATQVVTNNAIIYIPMEDLIDKDKELERLNREKTACQKDIDQLEGKINNQNFVAKAPEKVVEEIRQKLEKAKELLSKIENSINSL
ncbi:MAG: class I tRNA ligase family protein, partial [Oscillospiraceae bacterium]